MYGTPDLPQQRAKAHAEHVKELSHANAWLEVRDIDDHIESDVEQTGPMEWRLCASATQVGDEVVFRSWFEGKFPPGSRFWVAATAVLYRHSQPLESTVVPGLLLGVNSTNDDPKLQFVFREKAQSFEDYAKENEDIACYPPLIWIGATITTWSDTLGDKEEQDDVKFAVQGHVIHANKAHMSYISPVLRNIMEHTTGSSEEVILDDTAEAFIIFMKAVLPGPREPITDSTVQLLYRMAVKYGVKFLIEKCEQHLVATNAMTKNEKVLLADELHRTQIVDYIIAGTTREPSASEDIFHKGEQDDVEFTTGGRSVYANKEYISYHSTMLRGMLRDHFHQGNSDQGNIQKMPITTNTDEFVLFMKAISPCQLDITDNNVQRLYRLADYYGARFLEKSRENHMLATKEIAVDEMKGIPVVERIITAQSLSKTDFITRLIANMSAEDVKSVLWSPRKKELSEDVARQLSDHYVKKTKTDEPRRLVVPVRSASNTVGNSRSSLSDSESLPSTTSSESSLSWSSSSSDTTISSF